MRKHVDEEACQHQQPQQKPAAISELSAASEMSGEDAPNKVTDYQPDDSGSLTRPCSSPAKISDHLRSIEAAQQEPDGFTARVAAALEASSQIIGNLTARLEAMVYYRSRVRIQGHAECCAAWAM